MDQQLYELPDMMHFPNMWNFLNINDRQQIVQYPFDYPRDRYRNHHDSRDPFLFYDFPEDSTLENISSMPTSEEVPVHVARKTEPRTQDLIPKTAVFKTFSKAFLTTFLLTCLVGAGFVFYQYTSQRLNGGLPINTEGAHGLKALEDVSQISNVTDIVYRHHPAQSDILNTNTSKKKFSLKKFSMWWNSPSSSSDELLSSKSSNFEDDN